MEDLVHLNGTVMPSADAHIPVMDRGFLFADAAYEGLGVLDGQVVDFLHHMERLERSLRELSITVTQTNDDWWDLLMALVTANSVDEGFLYLHISRGAGDTRSYVPPTGLVPTVFAFIQRYDGPHVDDGVTTLRLASSLDLRWARRDIKTPNLLGQVLAKQHAESQGCDEALLVTPDGEVTECGSRSFFIVTGGSIVTRPTSNQILSGVTRRAVIAVAANLGLSVDERIVSLAEAKTADEAFATAASTYVQPVVAIDDVPIGDGSPGPVALKVREDHIRAVRDTFYSPD